MYKLKTVETGVMITVIKITKEEIKKFEMLDIISQYVLVKEKVRYFEQKYESDFETFERRIAKEKEEDFQKWDDYIEWKAYVEKLRDLEAKLREVENAEDVEIS